MHTVRACRVSLWSHSDLQRTLPIFVRITSLVPRQSNVCPSASEAILTNMGGCIKELLKTENTSTTKHIVLLDQPRFRRCKSFAFNSGRTLAQERNCNFELKGSKVQKDTDRKIRIQREIKRQILRALKIPLLINIYVLYCSTAYWHFCLPIDIYVYWGLNKRSND